MTISLAEHEDIVTGIGVVLVDQGHILGGCQFGLALEVDAEAVMFFVILGLFGYVPYD